MVKAPLWVVLFALSACYRDPNSAKDWDTIKNEVAAEKVKTDKALAAGALVKRELHLSPDLSHDRWFKVEDQYGCVWWINSGHKFDQKQIDVRDNGEANCPTPEVAPPKSIIYLDRAGNIVDQ